MTIDADQWKTPTPQPWLVIEPPDPIISQTAHYEIGYYDTDRIYWTIATLEQGRATEKADAALIVNAVNNHATLVSALQTLANDCTLILDGDDMSGMSDGEIFGAMRDTINYALEGVTS